MHDKSYEEQLSYKVAEIKEDFNLQNLDILTSKPEHFRTRAEFRIFHDDEGISYAMNRLEKKGLVKIKNCSIVSDSIASLMPKLLEEVIKNQMLKERLFAVEFLSSQLGEMLVTLIYHKKIDSIWEEEAKKLATSLNIDLIGRSRKVKIVVTKEFINETLNIQNKPYHYKLYDTGFTQPNSGVNEKMIGWVKEQLGNSKLDLLELYCGHGNFSLPLSFHFRYVLATEVSKRSIQTAYENCELNSITNIDFVRLSSEELTEALEKKREFRRLKDVDIEKFSFDTVFVDPPRAGLDEKTLSFISEFNQIIYISCNPQTLKRDLDILKNNFNIKSFAVFDQFSYTYHLECGVILTK
jgi:tRNA (uracil-5-)-methyltransferase